MLSHCSLDVSYINAWHVCQCSPGDHPPDSVLMSRIELPPYSLLSSVGMCAVVSTRCGCLLSDPRLLDRPLLRSTRPGSAAKVRCNQPPPCPGMQSRASCHHAAWQLLPYLSDLQTSTIRHLALYCNRSAAAHLPSNPASWQLVHLLSCATLCQLLECQQHPSHPTVSTVCLCEPLQHVYGAPHALLSTDTYFSIVCACCRLMAVYCIRSPQLSFVETSLVLRM